MYARHIGWRWHNCGTLTEYTARGQAALLALMMLLLIVMDMAMVELVQQLFALHKQIESHVGGRGRHHLTIGQLKVAHIRFGIQAAINYD